MLEPEPEPEPGSPTDTDMVRARVSYRHVNAHWWRSVATTDTACHAAGAWLRLRVDSIVCLHAHTRTTSLRRAGSDAGTHPQ